MNKKTLILAMVSLFIFGLVNFDLARSNSILFGNWVKLGSKKVNLKVDRDVINSGAKGSGFVSLKYVTEGDLNIHHMAVYYNNGTKELFQLSDNFTQNTSSETIDLKGKRIITKIAFGYDAKKTANKHAIVTVYGKN